MAGTEFCGVEIESGAIGIGCGCIQIGCDDINKKRNWNIYIKILML